MSSVGLKWGIVLCSTLSVAAIHWPNPQLEQLDGLLWQGNFLELVTGNCTMRDNTTIAAQWVRLAYHDMSTHNVDDGTGGLDGSITYELDRAQNVGIGMAGSVNDFLGFTHPTVGLADLIALGTVLGVASCGGPLIPFRGGRIDVTSAGPATVPEPQQDLASHTESFRRQGFTQSEMIALVACGHSLGGVRRGDFPDIVKNPDEVISMFDETHSFDNNVVTGYLQGSTSNPLVVGPNTTTNSDLRIFSSDGNATMQSIASPDAFSKTCENLLERMINTVPRGVQLTDVLEPIQYKVGQSRLFPTTTNGILRFTTSLRVIGSNPQRKVTLLWNDRQGSICPETGCSSAGSFWFKVDEGDGSEPVLVNNDGVGLLIEQDTVLYDRARTSFVFQGSVSLVNIVVAVRGDRSTKVSLSTFEPATGHENPVPKRETVDLAVDSRFAPVSGYTFFSTNVSNRVQWFDIVAEIGGETIRETNVQASTLRE
ncbi:heme peroxidase [Marasmius fiardii PR-910]|nr:heme peroxidase [Marasmius fiardii PR-910]